MEWLSKKDYTDNWDSEMNEAFCFWSYAEWEPGGAGGGLRDLAPGSQGFTTRGSSSTASRPSPRCARPANERALPWPDTHLRLVARRPAA